MKHLLAAELPWHWNRLFAGDAESLAQEGFMTDVSWERFR